MSSNSRKFLIGLGGAILLSFVIAGVAVIAYTAGRNSAPPDTMAAQAVEIVVDNNEGTIELPDASLSTPTRSGNDEVGQDTATATDEAGVDQESGEAATDEGAELDASTPEPTAPEQPGAEPAQEEGPRIPVELDSKDIELLLEVWEIIDEQYDGQLPEQEDVTYRAIAGSLELLGDDYTRFITPEMAERLREQLNGSFEGIGAFVDLNPDGYLLIVRPMEDQPADQAGMLANDLVTHVNGQSVLGMTLEEITAEVKGPEGTEVVLTIQRESVDEPFDVTVERKKIEIPIVSSEMLEENVAYVRLTGFSSNAAEQLEAELKQLLDQNPIGLILDLRDNPGGFLSQSVQVADLLLGDGVVVYERDGRDLEEEFLSESGDLAEEIRLVVLVNAGSASASEIVAGAVKDRDRGILIGETTLGKGSVQQPHTLSDGSELRVTIARWYTPDNKSIDSEGISPDIAVDAPEEFGTEADTQLQRAIQFLLDESD